MQVNKINENMNFKAKLVHTKDLLKVVQYAKNDPILLNDLLLAEKNINSIQPNTKLIFELFQTVNNLPFVIITRIKSSKGIKAATQAKNFTDYEPIIIQSKKAIEPLMFGFSILKKIGHIKNQNPMFKKVVLGENVPIDCKKYTII